MNEQDVNPNTQDTQEGVSEQPEIKASEGSEAVTTEVASVNAWQNAYVVSPTLVPKSSNPKENQGKLARDIVTGFSGIILAHVDHLFNCIQYNLKPQCDRDGKMQDSKWFDEGRIEIIGWGVVPSSVQADRPGCDDCELPNL